MFGNFVSLNMKRFLIFMRWDHLFEKELMPFIASQDRSITEVATSSILIFPNTFPIMKVKSVIFTNYTTWSLIIIQRIILRLNLPMCTALFFYNSSGVFSINIQKNIIFPESLALLCYILSRIILTCCYYFDSL